MQMLFCKVSCIGIFDFWIRHRGPMVRARMWSYLRLYITLNVGNRLAEIDIKVFTNETIFASIGLSA